jgi:hypothetical protein
MGLLKIENYFETKIGHLRKCRKGVESFLDIESAPLFSERGQGRVVVILTAAAVLYKLLNH